MQATRIVLVRHGETDWNRVRRVQGHLDIPLNATGRRQAQRLANALKARDPLAAIYSSDLSRVLETARPLAEAMGQPILARRELRERHFGDFEGCRFVDIQERLPRQAERWRRRDPDWTPPGASESLAQFQQRCLAAVQELAALHPNEPIAVFTHGGVLDVLYRAATGMGLRDTRTWELGNAAINRLLWTPDSGFSLVGWADDSHLEALSPEVQTA